MTHFIIGTAGHVDHGKTALIRALTGIETDRLEEEKRRGLSIELGFAYFDLPDGTRAGIVDVPGHERFVDTMVSGAHGMDLVLFVVSAREGAQPQTLEHLQILDVLGVSHGILVVTMRDLVEEDELEFAIAETRELLEGTSLEGIPAVAVSSTTGEGIDELKALLAEAAQTVRAAPDPRERLPRLPIDRVFTLEGHGAIVTGTLRDGSLSVDQPVVIVPSATSARVRSIEVHGDTVERAARGQRTALNLVGVEKQALSRGDVVTVPALGQGSTRQAMPVTRDILVELAVVDDYPRIVEYWHQARLHVDTQVAFCRVILLMDDEVLPGDSVVAALRTDRPVLVTRGDRYVLRDESVPHTLGGGRVLDPTAVRHRRFAESTGEALAVLRDGDDTAVLNHLLARGEAPFVPQAALAPCFPLAGDGLDQWLAALAADRVVVRAGDQLILTTRFAALKSDITERLEGLHASDPLSPGRSVTELRGDMTAPVDESSFDWVLDELERDQAVVREGPLLRLPGHEVRFGDQDAEIRDALEALYREAGVSTPSSDELREKLPEFDPRRTSAVLRTLTQLGTLVRIAEDYCVHCDAYSEVLDRLRAHFAEHGSLSVAEFRELTGGSRKFAVPFLEHCDQRGWTRREGNVRRARPSFLAQGDEG